MKELVTVEKNYYMEQNLVNAIIGFTDRLSSLEATVKEQNKSLVTTIEKHSKEILDLQHHKHDCDEHRRLINDINKDLKEIRKTNALDDAHSQGVAKGVKWTAKTIWAVGGFVVAIIIFLVKYGENIGSAFQALTK